MLPQPHGNIGKPLEYWLQDVFPSEREHFTQGHPQAPNEAEIRLNDVAPQPGDNRAHTLKNGPQNAFPGRLKHRNKSLRPEITHRLESRLQVVLPHAHKERADTLPQADEEVTEPLVGFP